MSTGSQIARLKNDSGAGQPPTSITATAGGTLPFDENVTDIEIDIASDLALAEAFMVCPSIQQGRAVSLINLSATGNTLTLPANTLAAATEGMLIAGGDVTVNFGESVHLQQRVNGTWVRV